MKTLSKILIGASLLAVTAGGVAWARGPMQGCGAWGGPMMGGPMGGPMAGPMMGGPMGGPMKDAMIEKIFAALDANKDGVVTLDEAMKLVDERFDKIDANHDGVIDKAEVETWIGRRAPETMVKAFLDRHDLDGDGKITKAEFEKPFKKRFALYDRNDDGKVTMEEAKLAGPMGGMGMGFHGPRHGGHRGWGMMGPGAGWNMDGFGPMAGPMGGQMGPMSGQPPVAPPQAAPAK
ncbi:MAG: EF-hand domain-containing protein [Hyphomicrobiales bacterium]|nr:EF-hand domain-containing protein [Hyphomicrobiales bacterium]